MRSITLIGTDGVTVGPYYVGENPALWGAPPVEYEEAPAVVGSTFRIVRHAPRDSVLPILVAEDTPDDFDAAIRALLRAVDPTRGRVRILVTAESGEQRELTAYVIGGWETLVLASPDACELTVPLRVRAPNPYWRSVEDYEQVFGYAEWTSSDSEIPYGADLPYGIDLPYGGVTKAGHLNIPLRVNGDVVAWPRFEITGPAASVQLLNERTAQSWTYAGTLSSTDRLIVETEPGRRIITVNGLPRFGNMGNEWSWWGLLPGLNSVDAYVQTFGTGTSLSVTYTDQWLAP